MTSVLVQEFEKYALTIELPRGSLLFRLDEPCFGVYIVRTGKISLKWPTDSNVYRMEAAGPGSFVGLPAALNGSYNVTARVVEDSQLGLVSVDLVNYLLDCNPPLCLAAMELIAHEIRRMQIPISTGDVLVL